MNKQINLHTIAEYNGTEYELENLLNDLLYKIDQLQQELQRKDNIIKELEKWLNENNLYKTNDNILAKLKELENDNK